MKEVTIGSKNQIVIPKDVRDKVKHLKVGEKVAVYSLNDKTVILRVSDQNWVNRTYKSMKNTLKNIDPIKELNKMRDEW